ncbi:CLUMA_CG012332, isoform A [Clunio marinus]|uniref:CLUMA_CG012332, isoform A n=1 Tax=Clunio marinus TaxID=568069 RepID=A0A1J1IFJ3_9DIPT|nr:CLUMA_CG012332, isoform A [Clunio marinus]
MCLAMFCLELNLRKISLVCVKHSKKNHCIMFKLKNRDFLHLPSVWDLYKDILFKKIYFYVQA